MEVISLPSTEVSEAIIKMFHQVRGTMNEHGGKFNQAARNVRKNQAELKGKIIDTKNTLKESMVD